MIARSPMSLFLDFHEANTDAVRRALVWQAKNLPKKEEGKVSGWNPYAGFISGMRKFYRASMSREAVEQCLENWIQRGCISGERAKFLVNAFLYQRDERNYRFYRVGGRDVNIAGLTIRVTPDTGVETRLDENIIVKLWLREKAISDLRRQATIALLDEVRQLQMPPESHVGVWEVGEYRLDPWRNVPAEFTSAIRDTAERFHELWQAV